MRLEKGSNKELLDSVRQIFRIHTLKSLDGWNKLFLLFHLEGHFQNISLNGIENLNEEVIYKIIYAAVVSINDSYRLINIIEKSAPKFWDKLKSYDVSGMETASKMGDMGF